MNKTEINYLIRKSRFYSAWCFNSILPNKTLVAVFLVAGITGALMYLVSLISLEHSALRFLGLVLLLIAYISFSLGSFSHFLNRFGNLHPEALPMDTESIGLVTKAVENGNFERHFIELLLSSTFAMNFVRRFEFHPDDFIRSLRTDNRPPFFEQIFEKAVEVSKEADSSIKTPALIYGLMVTSPGALKYIKGLGFSELDIKEYCVWYLRESGDAELRSGFLNEAELMSVPGIGTAWDYAYTILLDAEARDLSLASKSELPSHLYGHRQTLLQIEQALITLPGNVVVVGEAGSGRHAVLEILAKKLVSGQTTGRLQFKRLLELNGASLSTNKGSVEHFKNLMYEAYKAGNVILVIDEIDRMFNSEHGEALRTAMIPVLKSDLTIIGLTGMSGYESCFQTDPELKGLFQKIEVREPETLETIDIVLDEAWRIEKQTGLCFTYPAIKDLVVISSRLITDHPHPRKALEIMDKALNIAAKEGRRWVGSNIIRLVLEEQTKVPLTEIAESEKSKLLELEDTMAQRIVGQKQAIRRISAALRRARSGIGSEERPIGSFLFIGPTGVGKTETCKALAEFYFGSVDRMVRFDMSEFKDSEGMKRLLIGTGSRGGRLIEAAREQPYGLMLFDEFEKANPEVWDLFLQVLDEGRLTDGKGNSVSFRNILIIATTNALSDEISGLVGKNLSPEKFEKQMLDLLRSKNIFRIELLNRFDGLIAFLPLTSNETREVAKILLNELNQRLKEKGIQIEITEDLVSALVSKGFDPMLGARPMRRLIQNTVEDYIAKRMLESTVESGETISIPPEVVS